MEYNLNALDNMDKATINKIMDSWKTFDRTSSILIKEKGYLAVSLEFVSCVRFLCKNRLKSFAREHFILQLEEEFEKNSASRFWRQLDNLNNLTASLLPNKCIEEHKVEEVLCKALDDISTEKKYQEKCVLLLYHALEKEKDCMPDELDVLDEKPFIMKHYQWLVTSLLISDLPQHFRAVHLYFKKRLAEFSTILAGDSENNEGPEDRDGCPHLKLLMNNIAKVVRNLRSLGFISIAEAGYDLAILLLIEAKVHDLAGDDYRHSVLEPINVWIQAVPLRFLYALLDDLDESISQNCTSSKLRSPSETLVRWKLRLEYSAYESLQELRISKLFEIIMDYPESYVAIKDLKECLQQTGQHLKLVDSFIPVLRNRLLIVGVSTNVILRYYISTIKVLRTLDPTGVLVEGVGEPMKRYLRRRKDTINCIVSMLSEGLLEEICKEKEIEENTDDYNFIYGNGDEQKAWDNAMRWVPDPIEADPFKSSRARRKADILCMILGIVSKERIVGEYHVMLAERLLNKTDYDIQSETYTLELLMRHFGYNNMPKFNIMLNDVIDSESTNMNIKEIVTEEGIHGASLEALDVTIISSKFWPPIQEEDFTIPEPMDQLLCDYAKRFNEIKSPRKLVWKKNVGSVKLELQYDNRAVQFTVSPLHAAIIMHFQNQKSWSSKNLAAIVGISEEVLKKRIKFWISKGIVAECVGTGTSEHTFSLVEDSSSTKSNQICEELVGDEGGTTTASIEKQLRKDLILYEKYIIGMITNFGSMNLDRIHNTLKIFCATGPFYNKSSQELQSFLSDLVYEEKLEFSSGMYFLKK